MNDEQLRDKIHDLLLDAVASEGVHLRGWVSNQFVALIHEQRREAVEELVPALVTTILTDSSILIKPGVNVRNAGRNLARKCLQQILLAHEDPTL